MAKKLSATSSDEVVSIPVKKPVVKHKKEKLFIERATFSNYRSYLITSIATAIGFSNFFIFPTRMIKYGGVAYLLPYFICLIFVGFPLSVMELSLGQIGRFGSGGIFGSLTPLFQGLGFAIVLNSFIAALRFNITIAYMLMYVIDSFRGSFLWSTCTNDWNSENCHSIMDDRNCTLYLNRSAYFYNRTCYSITDLPSEGLGSHIMFATDEYFERRVLNKSLDSHTMTNMVWYLVGWSTVGWLLVVLILAKGLKVFEKISYVVAIYPMVVFTILLIHLLSIENVASGMKELLKPQISELSDMKVWSLTILQVVFSLSISTGCLTAIGSYAKSPANLKWFSLIMLVADTVASLLMTLCTMAVVSFTKSYYLSKNSTGRNIFNFDDNSLTDSKYSSAFVIYPMFFEFVKGGQVYSFLFYTAVICLGLDTQYLLTELVMIEISDMHLPFRTGCLRVTLVSMICFLAFLFNLAFCTRGGYEVSEIFYDNLSSWPVVTFALLECLIVIYVYGIKRFAHDISSFLNFSVDWYLKLTWMISAPIILVTFIWTLLKTDREAQNAGVFDKRKTYTVAIIVSSGSLVFIPGFALYRYICNKRHGKPFMTLLSPNLFWPPKKAEYDLLMKEIEDAEKGIMGEYELEIPTKINHKKV